MFHRLLSRLWLCWLLCCMSTAQAQTPLTGEPLSPLPAVQNLNLDARKVQLGERLFKDVRFSTDNMLSCHSCHDLNRGGVDGLQFSIGMAGQVGPINAPTVFNSGLNFRQFWDGRSATLEDQIDKVIHNAMEMATTWPEIMAKLAADAALMQQFKATYPDGLQKKNIQDAIAVYERSLLTPSRFDRYLLGDVKAISTEEKQGYQLFKDYGCVACHQGANVGGNMFQKFGALNDYFGKRGNVTAADLGRFNLTQQEEDRHVFKVPSLRNVALTAPYFHDGSAQTLAQAVDVMFRHQLGRIAPDADKQLIVKFLGTLTGETLEVKP